MNLPTRKRPKAEVNIVPMVDVLTVLIFFFLLTMQFKEIYAVDITPPTMKSSTSAQSHKPDTIAVSKEGNYFFNGEPSNLNSIKEKIEKIAQTKDSAIIVMADQKTPLESVTDIIDLARLSKIRKLSLQTNK